ncbi:MAG: hypothetical protein LUG27_03130 [Clostridiales bacterium]|nr:hypothetical protein [Clostridiales bacterium]
MEKKNNLFDEHIEKQLDSLRKERQEEKKKKKTVPTLIGGVIAAIFIISVVMRFVL